MTIEMLKEKKVTELRVIAEALKIENADKMKKAELMLILSKMLSENEKENAKEMQSAPKKVYVKKAKAKEAEAEAALSEEEKETEKASEKNEESLPACEEEKAAEAVKEGKEEEITEEKAASEKSEETPLDINSINTDDYEKDVLKGKSIDELRSLAAELELEDYDSFKKTELREVLERRLYAKKLLEEKAKEAAKAALPEPGTLEYDLQRPDNRYETTGILDITDAGYGFLRFNNFLSSEEDVYVSQILIRKFALKTGDEITGIARNPVSTEKFGALLYIKAVNGDEPFYTRLRKDFSDLTPVFPSDQIKLENGLSLPSMRLVDLVAPIGKGQRGLIVAPPKAGKTTLLKQIAQAIESQNTDAELIVLLIDERPEEVTDMKKHIHGKVIYSTFDEQPSHHIKVAEMVLERARRLVEHGRDVIILLDSLTRLARAYNLVEPSSGKTLSGGLDPVALYKPKKFFGSARNMEEGGSITILATALVETGSRMDDMIFEEFKGTGNMELHLDRKLQEKRIFPAINLNKSGTRNEDLLMSAEELEVVDVMRRALADWGAAEATEKIVYDIVHTKNNAEFVMQFKKTKI